MCNVVRAVRTRNEKLGKIGILVAVESNVNDINALDKRDEKKISTSIYNVIHTAIKTLPFLKTKGGKLRSQRAQLFLFKSPK